jgi:hypothetical protein
MGQSALRLAVLLVLLAGLSTAQAECNKRILVARPTVTASSSSYASSSSSSGSKTSGETALAGGLLLKKGSKEDAVVKNVQVVIVVPGANKTAYVDATCPQGAADEEVPCTYNAKLPYANGGDGPDAYIKGIVTLDDGSTCVSDVLTVDPKAAAAAARKAAEDTVAGALADAAAIKAAAIARANAILAEHGLPPIDRSG